MGAAAELFVKVSADVKGLDAGMKDAAKSAADLGSASAAAVKPVSTLMDTIKGTAGGQLLADSLKGAGSAMLELGKQTVKLAGELEQNKVAFTTMLGSADKADKMLRDLASFAASTPFELRGLTDSSKKLLAFGFSAESVIPVMNSIGNAVAAVGGGKDVLDGVTMALGQMAAKGKVSAEEMNQLAERGIPAWKMLADGIGVSIPEAMKKAEKGSIDAGTAITALVNGMNQKFPGMMQKQSQTIMGALSNLQDSADVALTKVGQKLIETFNLTKLVQNMSVAISNLTAAFTTGGLLGVLDKAFGPTSKAAILGLAGALTVAMIPAIKATTVGLIGMVTAAAPFVALAGAIAFAAYPIIKNWDAIKGTVVALWDTAAQYTSAYYNRAVRIVNDLVKNWQIGFNYIGSAIRSVLGDDLTNKLLGGLGKVQQAFRGFSTIDILPLAGTRALVSQAAANFTETWSGAMSMAKGFTNELFRQASGSAVDFNKTVTREMLGFAKANQAATDTAKKGHSRAAAEARKHAAEVKKAAAEAKHLADATARGYERFELMARALGDVERASAAVDAKKQQLGRSFDEAGAKAEALRNKLGAVESAFGKVSPQAVNLRNRIAELQAASDAGGKATADAFKVIDEASTGLAISAEAARVLGDEYNAIEEAVKSAQDAMRKLIEMGIKPGNQAYDEQLKKLRDLESQQKAQPRTLQQVVDAQQDLIRSTSDTVGALSDVATSLGLQMPEVVNVAAKAMQSAAMSVGTLVLAFNAASGAVAAFNAILATNPVGAIALAVTAAVVAIAAAVVAVRGYQEEAAAKAAEEMRRAEEEANRVRDAIAGSVASGFKTAAKAFIDGAAHWGMNLRQQMRENLIQGVLDAMLSKAMMSNLAGLFEQVYKAAADPLQQGLEEAVAALGAAVDDQMRKMTPALTAASDIVNKYFPAVADKVREETTKTRSVADEATKEASRLREQHAQTLAGIYRNLERDSTGPAADRLLAQARILQGRSMAGDESLARGLATGGLVTGPTFARMGEGGRNEAVLPLNENVYRQIGQGIASARGGGTETQVVVQYYGSGKWTREDAQGLGRLLVSELRAMGVR